MAVNDREKILKPVPRFSPGFARPELRCALHALLQGRIVRGAGADDFSRELAQYLSRSAFLVPSARMGMWLLLRAMDLEPGEIIFPGLTYYAMPAAAKLAGFIPRFVDVDRHLLIDLDRLENAINERTRAIAPTHLYGRAVDMDRLMEIANRHNLPVIEDIAQGLGAAWNGRRVGTYGKAAIATFGPTKNITALGGGCLFVNDEPIAQRLDKALYSVQKQKAGKVVFNLAYASAMALVAWQPLFRFSLYPLMRVLRPYGRDPIADATADKPSDFQGIPAGFFQGQIGHLMGQIGRASLAAMDERNALRLRNGERLSSALAEVEQVKAPQLREKETAIFMSFPILVDDPDSLATRLLMSGVDTARGYMSSCARLPMFASNDSTPRADEAERLMLHLPVHPALSIAEMDEIAVAVKTALAARHTEGKP